MTLHPRAQVMDTLRAHHGSVAATLETILTEIGAPPLPV